jgi:myosin-1
MLAYLMRTEPVAVEQALLYRTITTGEQGRGRSSVYSCPQDPLGVCALSLSRLLEPAPFRLPACLTDLIVLDGAHHAQAIYSRDALSKALYSRMFDYIIGRVNDAMYIDDPEALTTGILDIYGFEIFGVRYPSTILVPLSSKALTSTMHA